MEVERLEKLEIVTVRLETTLTNLSEKIASVAEIVSNVNSLISSIALLNSRTDRLEQDIKNLATMLRDLKDTMTASESHNTIKLNSEFEDLDKRGVNRAYKFLGIGMTTVTLLFSYIYKDIKSSEHDQKAISEKISVLRTDLAILNKEVEDLRNDYKRINYKARK